MEMNTGRKWLRFAAGFILALLVTAFGIVVLDALTYAPGPAWVPTGIGRLYLVLCIPSQVLLMALASVAGALLARRRGGDGWKYALAAAWLAALAWLALTLWALVAVGVGS